MSVIDKCPLIDYMFCLHELLINKLDNLFYRYSIQQCMDIFGSQFNVTNIQRGVTQTNTNYGGYGIASSKVSQLRCAQVPPQCYGNSA